MLLMNILHIWAGDTCNMDVIKLEESVELIKEQAEIIAEYKTTIEALNKTMQEQGNNCKNAMDALNRTMQKQGEECKNTTEALNRTIQDQAAEMNQVKADVHKVNKSLGKFVCSTQGRQWLRSFEVCLNLCMDTEGENVGFIKAGPCGYLESWSSWKSSLSFSLKTTRQEEMFWKQEEKCVMNCCRSCCLPRCDHIIPQSEQQ